MNRLEQERLRQIRQETLQARAQQRQQERRTTSRRSKKTILSINHE